MPELMIDFITSLDGYGAAEGWPGWWGLEGPEYLAWLGDQPEAGYTLLMGANTYRLMSGLASEGEPGTDALAGLPKLVFSSTLQEPLAWPNSRLISRDPVGQVAGPLLRLDDDHPFDPRQLGSPVAQVAGTSEPPSWETRGPKRTNAGCEAIFPATSDSPMPNDVACWSSAGGANERVSAT